MYYLLREPLFLLRQVLQTQQASSKDSRETLTTRCQHNRYWPLSRIQQLDIQNALKGMEMISTTSPVNFPPASSGLTTARTVIGKCLSDRKPMVCSSDVHPEVFEEICRLGVPCIFENVSRKQTLPWDPQYMVQKYGDMMVRLVDCATHRELPKRVTVKEFFSIYAAPPGDRRAYKLKVQLFSMSWRLYLIYFVVRIGRQQLISKTFLGTCLRISWPWSRCKNTSVPMGV
jgi:hypothetical protein